jgi:UDP-N-acetylglucosamine--N-acetylmuramyl-(pentapeptide) pyrophosphoryl-undecaprenol N-acetylglucosamine transferase
VTNNHQEKNARVLEEGGGAVVVLEKDCTPEKMYSEIKALLADPERMAKMAAIQKETVRADSCERICDIVEELVSR